MTNVSTRLYLTTYSKLITNTSIRMENLFVISVVIRYQESKLSQSIKGFYMKESNSIASSATFIQHQWYILFNTKGQCMKGSNIPASIAAIKQLQRDTLLVTRRQCMKEWNIAAMKQLQREVLLVTRRQCMQESNTFPTLQLWSNYKGESCYSPEGSAWRNQTQL